MHTDSPAGADHRHGLAGSQRRPFGEHVVRSGDGVGRDRRLVEAHAVGHTDEVGRRQYHRLGENAVDVDADVAPPVGAQRFPAAGAHRAAAAGQVERRRHPVAGLPAGDTRADGGDRAAELVADDAGGRTAQRAGPGPFEGQADAAGLDRHQHLADTGRRLGDVAHGDVGAELLQDRGPHHQSQSASSAPLPLARLRRSAAIFLRITVLVPSEWRKIVASRISFSMPTSRMTAEPPNISNEPRVTSKATWEASSFGMAAIFGSKALALSAAHAARNT